MTTYTPVKVSFTCPGCGELFDTWDYMGNKVRHSGSLTWVCDACLSDYTLCDKCEEYHHMDDIKRIDGTWPDRDRYVCSDCREGL